jgi:hypothetical protein
MWGSFRGQRLTLLCTRRNVHVRKTGRLSPFFVNRRIYHSVVLQDKNACSPSGPFLGARPRISRDRVPGAADAPAAPESKGRMGVARRSLRCSSSTMCTDIASSSRLALAAQAPCARPLLILGRAPRDVRSAAPASFSQGPSVAASELATAAPAPGRCASDGTAARS